MISTLSATVRFIAVQCCLVRALIHTSLPSKPTEKSAANFQYTVNSLFRVMEGKNAADITKLWIIHNSLHIGVSHVGSGFIAHTAIFSPLLSIPI
jgi:hypothetical protein